MMKHEFEDLTGKQVSDEDYSTVNYVYTWYPTISETEGKAQIAKLYTDFGMSLIEDMAWRAGQMEKSDKALRENRRSYVRIQNQIKELRGEEL